MVLAQDLVRTYNRYWWETSFPYSSYLYGFAVGPFREERIQTGKNTLIYMDATGSNQDLKTKFAKLPLVMNTISDRLMVVTPNREYTQLLVPGHEAQEAATYALIGLDALNRDLAEPDSAWILAHEAAHQWWGNLVTCASWRDFWINEGLATYMAADVLKHSQSNDAYQLEMDRARTRLAKARALGFDKPLRWSGKYPSLSVRRAVQYSKGALFIEHLREKIGAEQFQLGLMGFLEKHEGGTVTSNDFERAMQDVTEIDLRPDFKEWVYGDDVSE